MLRRRSLIGGGIFGWTEKALSRRFPRRGCRTCCHRPLLRRSIRISSRCALRRRCLRVAQNDRNSVPAGADNDNFRVGRLRKLKCGLDAPPLQVGVGDPLADDLLKFVYAFRLDLLSLGLPYLACNTEFVLF